MNPVPTSVSIFKVLILAVLSVFFTAASAQIYDYSIKEECLSRSGFEYGGFAGFYLPGKGSAGFYSGKPDQENNASYIFKNKYWYEEIFYNLDANDTVFIAGYPDKVKYTPSFEFGLFFSYNFNCHTSLYFQFSYVKLQIKDILSVEVDPPIDYLAEPDLRLFGIRGEEERNILDVAVNHYFGNNPVFRPMIGIGINMNNTLVKKHVLRIADKDYNLVNIYGNRPYIPGGTQQGYDIRQGGIGFGVFATVGARLEFSKLVAIEPGFTFYYKQINLESAKGFYPQYNLFVRLCFRDLISFND
jgi:hypothetical protein